MCVESRSKTERHMDILILSIAEEKSMVHRASIKNLWKHRKDMHKRKFYVSMVERIITTI